jgi:undecaprenyl-phosphate 4-deoxy-4-formamido-L-arabinose transferase
VVIPLYDEAPTIGPLHSRLTLTLQGLGKPYEVVYVDDGSRDATPRLLRELHGRDPTVRVVRLRRNYGQHAAVLAGFAHARGEVIVTLDGDLQNPPEEIPKLLRKLQEGYEVVGGWRRARRDPLFRRAVSAVMNRAVSRMVGVPMRDYGCMLRAYRRPVVDRILQCPEPSRFIPAAASALAGSVAEVEVAHAPRAAGRSKYGLVGLLGLALDLLTALCLLALGPRRRTAPGRPRYTVAEILQ